MKKRLLAGLVLALSATAINAAGISGQGTWETTLQARDLDPNAPGIEAYYDTALNITWVADADLARSMGFYTYRSLTWGSANEWIAAINSANYLGYSDWRLPKVGPVNGSTMDFTSSYNGSTDVGFNISAPGSAYPGSTASEMAHLHYSTLGNIGYYDSGGTGSRCSEIPPYCRTNAGPFSNIITSYWSGTRPEGISNRAFAFGFYNGSQFIEWTRFEFGAWAVRDGDSALEAPVPVPAAVWLFGGALGVLGMARRKISNYGARSEN